MLTEDQEEERYDANQEDQPYKSIKLFVIKCQMLLISTLHNP